MSGIRLLILGGTLESRALAQAVAGRRDISALLSLAGRTSAPEPFAIQTRIGGFGGAEGLAEYLRLQGVTALIDATHPFAARISTHAEIATRNTGVPLLALRRAPWTPVPGDRWTSVPSAAEAVTALGADRRRVLLAIGRGDIAGFEAAPQHFYVVRSVDPIEPPAAFPDAVYIVARGPFSREAELALLREHAIDAVVAKNSGGKAGSAKLAATRELGIETILLTQPPAGAGEAVNTVEAAIAWLDRLVRK